MASRKSTIAIAAITGLAGLTVVLLMFRTPMVPLTEQNLAEARQRWEAANIQSYNLLYNMHGGLYDVKVRDGKLTSLLLNSREPDTSQPELYTMQGLFDTLEMELELPQPTGKTMLRQVLFDANHGGIRQYLRSGGPGKDVVIQLVRLRINPSD